MAKPSNQLTVAELEDLLARRKIKLERLLKKKKKLERDLMGAEKEIAKLGGGNSRNGKFSRLRAVRKRPKNKRPLRQTINEILGRNKKGLTLAQIADKTLASGYKSNSTDFKNVVYQCLYGNDEFSHDDKSGTYKTTAKAK